MLEQSVFAINDPRRVREVVHRHPWATIVTHIEEEGLVVSHLPVLIEEATSDAPIAVLGHLARTDADTHELGSHDVAIIVEGPNGYLSPSWYDEIPHVPTWDFVVVHLHGRPELLSAEETYSVLSRTVDRFESALPSPWKLTEVEDYAQGNAVATTGFRLRPSRVAAKAKLSQDESVHLRQHAIRGLRADGPYRNE